MPKRKRGRPRKGEKVAKEPGRLERQSDGMNLEQMLDDLPGACDHGSKKNAKGFLVSWIGYKLHLDTADCGVLVSANMTSASVHDSQDTTFMIDANCSMSVERSIEAAGAFEPCDIYWFEEPIVPDDYAGYARIAEATGLPLVMGENLHTIHKFELALSLSKLALIQPDVSNCGGITGWLNVARTAHEHGLPVSSHGMQELHVGLVAGQQNQGWVEAHSSPIDLYTRRPLVLTEGRAVASDAPGTGVDFVWKMLDENCTGKDMHE